MNIRDSRFRSSMLYRARKYGAAYLFMLPWIFGFLAFMLFPLAWSFYMSFHRVSVRVDGFRFEWIGLDNFRNAVAADNEFPIAIILYVQETILMIPVILIFSFLISLLLNQRFPGRMWFRAVFFLPVVFSTGQVLAELFVQGAGELPFLEQYNVEGLVREYAGAQLADPIVHVLDRIVLILWNSGVQILIFIAGFQTIPQTVYDAVRIDGASPWESFWKITLPAMVPFIGLNAVFTVVDLSMLASNPILHQVQSNMFRPDRGYGYASAVAWMYFALVFAMLGLCIRLAGRNRPGRRG